MDLLLPCAFVDTLYFDPNNHPIDFANLNFLYWILFGQSSLELSALVPCNPSANKKDLMYLIYDKIFGLWSLLDHQDSIQLALDSLKKEKILVITTVYRASKSTDWDFQFLNYFNSGTLDMPQVSLVQTHALILPNIYSGSIDTFNKKGHNVCTFGLLQDANIKFEENFIVILDEIHELNEDALILVKCYKRYISAIPINILTTKLIHLTKNKSPYTFTQSPISKDCHLKSAIYNYLKDYPELKTLVIHHSLSQCIRLYDTLTNTLN
ncbi:6765_t:CDS:2 [Gigaspora margarita]|uniref:6765_t:CDS:1 n=1 Tax=Gigaspora margarita TaxID=4874 RepID=A0ABN7V4Z4_GIGMA|nr:6765_t:CDS:2 [Gigaspora margarita]